MATTTVFPPAPSQFHEGFDTCQFDNRRSRAISKETGISFNDFSSMHVRRSKGNFFQGSAPVWAMDDSLLREVITTYIERRYYCKPNRSLSYAERLSLAEKYAVNCRRNRTRVLDDLLDRQKEVSPVNIQNVDTQIVLDGRGMASIVAAACYLRYRCGWTSPEIANEIRIKPPHVRIILWRLSRVYKQIQSGIPYRERRPRTIKGTTHKTENWTPEKIADIRALRTNGWPWQAIAAEFDKPLPTVMAAFWRHTHTDA